MNGEDRIQQWLNGPVDQETKQEILTLQKEDPKALEEAFATTLQFGTGGMRGLMGVGTNRLNIYTIQMATQGLANFLLQQPLNGDKHSVFISYDNRHDSPLFAHIAARVLAGNGIETFVTAQLMPTPFVSFGLREKRCSAGIMITASHNPKEYNGYKVYGPDGGQVVDPHAQAIVAEVAKIERLDQIHLAPDSSPLIQIPSLDLDLHYIETIKKLSFHPKKEKKEGDRLRITYTPLHGCGIKLVPKALQSWGFSDLHFVDEQIVPDPDFSTVTSPNPENPESLKMGIATLQSTQSDLLIATDPDADRMAAVAMHKEKPFFINGNQIASLCLEYICATHRSNQTLPSNGAAITTIVSTDLLAKIAQNYSITLFQTLTGFKYIGELIGKWEKTKAHTFLFGAEESYGYLIGTHSRDKDGVVMSCILSEIAFIMKLEGKTLIDYLEMIYSKYGFFYEKQKVLSFPPGREGMKEMEEKMEKLRKNHPTSILGKKIEVFEDYQKALHELPPSNVILIRLDDRTKLVIRPSGTEPKLKIYGGIHLEGFSKIEQDEKECEKKLSRAFTAIEELL